MTGMRIQAFYRCALWLPLVVPALTAVVVHGADIRPTNDPLRMSIQMLLASLIYGGVPYAALALWGTVWIGARPEREIRHRALYAPLLMCGVWIPVCVLFWALSGSAGMFLGLLGLGALVIAVLGYAYVGVVVLLRSGVARLGWFDGPDDSVEQRSTSPAAGQLHSPNVP